MVEIRVKMDEIGCRKPGCKRRLSIPHRHHRKCETLFFRAWLGKRPKWVRALQQRYEKFLPEDTVILCSWHHAEIHMIYDDIIKKDMQRTRKPIYRYSKKQMERLMKQLEDECLDWEQDRSPGVDPDKVFTKEHRIAE